MFVELLYWIVLKIAELHDYLINMVESHGFFLSDKQLHFIFIGILGMLILFVIHPLFAYLVKKNKILTLSGIYVFTVVLIITFAIEIGQQVTGTGDIEFFDIVYGMAGFIAMFVIFAICRFIWHRIRDYIESRTTRTTASETESDDASEEKSVIK